MKLIITPGSPLRGTARVPGDKSLSHRALLFAALAEGESRIGGFLVSGVTRVMLEALSALGVEWRLDGETLTVQGRGPGGLRPPRKVLYCGNSATTIRLLAGALAAAGIPAVLDGSAGLRRRPMGRITAPLAQMGAAVESAEGGAPLRLAGRAAGQRLRALEYSLPVASAQVKTCLLLAALAADGPVTLREPGPSRDHTERMLRSMGVEVSSRALEEDGQVVYETRLTPPSGSLQPIRMDLPGDMSAAAFLITAAVVTPGSEITLPGVNTNPTRTGLVDALRAMGADITVEESGEQGGEPVGCLRARSSKLRGTEVSGPLVVRMIDEFSIFGVAAAYANGESVVSGAEELRYKESDRIATLCAELRGLGVEAVEAADGFTIRGGGPAGGTARAHGDHRLAMAMAVAGLSASAPVTVEGAEMIHESFPGFVETLRRLGASLEVMEGEADAARREDDGE